MIANSDDKTVLATHLSRQTKEDTHLLELFKPIGYVRSAKLAIDHETGLGGGFGF
ncbi:eukaryotic translation initiation factor 3 subunit G-like, partial [Trifolium medium]|nr:eukaryotic translation initiation factor 3 subunit G-like [Trifolium medium]